jgi:DMSO reductase family type II enzyme heme b subunit
MMRALTTLATAALLAGPARAPATPAAEAFLAAESVPVRALPAPLPEEASAPAWEGVPATAVLAAPQRTIRLHDQRANRALEGEGARQLLVRAVTDGRDLALAVEWADPTEDRAASGEIDAFGDAAALQLPLRFGAGVRLPYVGMGDEVLPVAIHMVRAGAQGAEAREGVAAGFGSFRRADVGRARVSMRHDARAGTWRAVFLRPLAGGGLELRRGLVPFALAVWDGSRGERGGNKALTGWKFLRLEAHPLDPAFLAEQSFGHGPGDLGSAPRGRALAEGMCAPCHVMGDLRGAPPGLAPDLSSIGAVATPRYLQDSLVAPSAVIVPSPNPAQHQDRSAKRDPRGGYPSSDGYLWHTVGPDGKKSSTMSDFSSMSRQELADVLAYLMTLGREPGGRKRP